MPTRELKPPQELVDAIQNSPDMTAPPSAEGASELTGANVPRTIRNRLAHEDFDPMTEEQKEELERRKEQADHSNFLADPQERRAHMEEIQKEQASAMRFDRQHPGGGRAGQGDAGTVQNFTALKSGNKAGGFGPHFRDVYSQSKQ